MYEVGCCVMQDSMLGTGRISTILNDNDMLRTVVIGYAIAPQPQLTSTFVVGQNITTTAARNADARQTPISIRVTGTNPLMVSLLDIS